MNRVVLTGRLTKDVELKYTASQMPIATFDLAVDRPARQGVEKQTDFLRIVVYGKQAESCSKYIGKGRLVAVAGRIQTGSYTNKEGRKVYTTEIASDSVEFLDWGEKKEPEPDQMGFAELEEEIPF